MTDTPENIVTLTDAAGNDVDFEILDVVPYHGKEYAVLFPLEEDGGQPEAVILELLPGEADQEEMLQGLSDPALLETIFQLFLARNDGQEEGQ